MSESIEIKKLNASHYDEAIDFLNMVFSMAFGPHDFPELLPSLYRRTDQSMGCNWAVFEEGKIKGLVGVFPRQIKVGGRELRLAGIGGVSAHPQSRGSGYMRKLMAKANEEMETGDYDLSWLAGIRQRYQNFKFEKGGSLYVFDFIFDNVKRCEITEDLKWQKIEKEDLDNIALLENFNKGQAIAVLRGNDFFDISKSWNRELWKLEHEGKLKGFAISEGNGKTLYELRVDDEGVFSALKSFMQIKKCDQVSIQVHPSQYELINEFSSVCEKINKQDIGNWRCFNWPKTIQALLEVKAKKLSLPDGQLKIKIGDQKAFSISLKEGVVSYEWIQEDVELQLTEFEAIRVFSGPLSPEEMGYQNDLLVRWCPLPWSWLFSDCL